MFVKNGGIWLNDKRESDPKGNVYWGRQKKIKKYSNFNHGQMLYKIGNNKTQELNSGITIKSIEQEGYLTIIMNNSEPEIARDYFDITIEVTE